MVDTVFFSGDGQGFNNFTGAIEAKGLKENFQNRKLPHYKTKD
jgi:hypothetical protein